MFIAKLQDFSGARSLTLQSIALQTGKHRIQCDSFDFTIQISAESENILVLEVNKSSESHTNTVWPASNDYGKVYIDPTDLSSLNAPVEVQSILIHIFIDSKLLRLTFKKDDNHVPVNHLDAMIKSLD